VSEGTREGREEEVEEEEAERGREHSDKLVTEVVNLLNFKRRL